MSRASWNFRNRVGKYELGRVLGEGSFGKVHLARDVETGEKRAIKVINKDRVVKDMMVAQIKREISTMKLAKHPNVVHLFEVMASKTKIYFVLEYVTGGELFDKIAKQGKLREEEARKYFQQLINAVDYCHSKGVYHRDLKLENLLLDEDGNLKISDFGLSALPQQVREDGLLHTTCGTPNYVAPEVIVDKGYDGAKADIWSCGVVLFVLMAGYLPFDEPNIMNLYKKIYRADFTCPDWFSSAARRLIIRILEPNPKNRITIPHIMESPWFKKGYKPAKFKELKNVDSSDIDLLFSTSNDCTLSDQKEEKDRRPSFLNAFDIISLSEGLNLSGLFEKEQGVRREMRFTLRCSASEILAKMEESAKPLGFSVKRRDYKMRLEGRDLGRKGHLTISTEVLEVSPLLSVVEMKKAGGDALEFDRFYENYSAALKDVVWTADARALN
ncbi:CBL-interacting serine/threonine-protein kinase 23-like isoform X4 [Magnolia sinica]|uniref:CBL-interacting serine/threonine-protein kinase 23-like isoform X4 n=1 Tax=Magnolia sinica TaxID=86752 RepID=UPI00265B0708|nr:CBL-interacting serine/threonine-protein kinase 23-like isoform X4 [Magnolia sinica]